MRAATEATLHNPSARLLAIGEEGVLSHSRRSQLAALLEPGDLLVANDAATIPASLAGLHLRSGEPIEVRLAGRRSLDRNDVRAFTAVLFGGGDHRTPTEHRAPPPRIGAGDVLQLGPLAATVYEKLGHARLVRLGFHGSVESVWNGIATHGRPIQYAHVQQPLEMWDVWTNIAVRPVAFEAPSAGFALDWQLLRDLSARGVSFATLTHAAGISSTGDPALDARFPLDEAYDLPPRTVSAIERTRISGGRIVAVGTTVTRALEHAASRDGRLRAGAGLATGRIGPRTELTVVDAVLSGVHEPGDSHYELLRAFTGDDVLERSMREMERAGYRSHEFGDSVFLSRCRPCVEARNRSTEPLLRSA